MIKKIDDPSCFFYLIVSLKLKKVEMNIIIKLLEYFFNQPLKITDQGSNSDQEEV